MGETNSKLKILKEFIFEFWPIFVIILLVMVFSFPYWAKGLIPFPSSYLVTFFPPWQYYYGMPVKNNAMPDVLTQMYPFKHLVIKSWKRGEVPLWNPYNFSGNPLLANYQSAPFHHANFLFFLLPQVHAWSIMIILQPIFGGLFTYLFCKQLKLSNWSALLSGISFMFCGFVTVWMAYGTMSWGLVWLPLILYAIEKNFQKVSSGSLILISISLAFSFFSGHFQISLYVLLTVGFYLFFKLLTTRKFRTFLTSTLFLILGVLIASPQVVPSLELHNLSVRKDAFVISEKIPWRYLPTLIAPDFYGNPVTRNDWFGHYAEWSGFTGVITLILALWILLGRKNSHAYFFSFLFLFSFFLAREGPLLDLLEKLKIPVFSTSAAARINSIFSFSVAILGGYGLEKLINELRSKNFKLPCKFLFLLVVLISSIWIWLLLIKPFPSEKIIIAKRNFILPTALSFSFLFLLIFFKLSSKFIKKNYLNNLVIFLILALTTFDLCRFANKWMPFDPPKYLYPSVPILEFLKKEVKPPARLFGFLGMEMQNYFELCGLEGYDPLYIQRYGELLTAASEGKIVRPSGRGVGLAKRGKYTIKILNLLGVKYILHAISDDRHVWAFNWWDYPEQFKEIYYEENKYQVFENLEAYPRAFLVYNYKVEKEPQKIIDLMWEEDLRKTVILEEDPSQKNFEIPKISPRVDIVNYLPNKIEIKVNTEKSGLLFLSDNYYPGWKAKIDGKTTKIYRANYTFRAIEVPAGSHNVDFIYRPKSFKIGATLSLISLLVCLFVALFGFKKI